MIEEMALGTEISKDMRGDYEHLKESRLFHELAANIGHVRPISPNSTVIDCLYSLEKPNV